MNSMNNQTTKTKSGRTQAEASLNKTSELNQVIAQFEASLTRTENQMVTEKFNKNRKNKIKEVSNL